MQTTTYGESVLTTIQVMHLNAALASLRRLDDEVGPCAHSVLAGWTALNGALSSDALGQAEALVGSIRAVLRDVHTFLQLANTTESEAAVQNIRAIEELAVGWMACTRQSIGLPSHQVGWQGVSMLYQGQRRVRELIASLTRQVAGGGIVLPAPAPKDRLKWSPDFSSVTIDGTLNYTFSGRQRGPVKLLVEAFLNGTPALSHARLLEASGGDSHRLRDVFKRSGNRLHPAWGTLIAKCAGASDLYHISLPPFGSRSIPGSVPA